MKADRRRLARVGRSPPSLTVGGVSFPTVVRGRLSRRVSIAALPRRRSMSNDVMALVHGGARGSFSYRCPRWRYLPLVRCHIQSPPVVL